MAVDMRAKTQRLLSGDARVQDVSMLKNPLIRRTKNGDEKTPQMVCSWQDGSKTITKYLESCQKMSESETLEKARALKKMVLGIDEKHTAKLSDDSI